MGTRELLVGIRRWMMGAVVDVFRTVFRAHKKLLVGTEKLLVGTKKLFVGGTQKSRWREQKK